MCDEEKAAESKGAYSHRAAEVYNHKLLVRPGCGEEQEASINRLAKRMAQAKKRADIARYLALKERLIASSMSFFYVEGYDTSTLYLTDSCSSRKGYDDVFIDVLLALVDRYEDDATVFTHSVRYYHKRRKQDAARRIAREDARFGGGLSEAASIQEPFRADGDDGASLEDMLAVPEGRLDSVRGVEEASAYGEGVAVDEVDDAADEALLLKTLSLITMFLGKSGRASNDMRKLYTRMFFSETLTRIVKTRTTGELTFLCRQERELFSTIEAPFQDSYTVDICRSILQLWETNLVEGVPEIRRPFNDESGKTDEAPTYYWKLPASVYIAYLKSLELSASDALVSQQRKHYNDLLMSLGREGEG